MNKKILSAALAAMLLLSAASITASAEGENEYWIEAGSNGKGTEDDPFGTFDEAIMALDGKDGTIYVYGTYGMDDHVKGVGWDGMITVKGATKDSTIHVEPSNGIVFGGDITFKDILFDMGKYSHFNPLGELTVFDIGEGVSFNTMMHLTSFENMTVDHSTHYIIESGEYASALHLGGGYSTSYANGNAGSTIFEMNGGTVKYVGLKADHYKDDQVGISVGGNVSVVYNGGTLTEIGHESKFDMEIMGALNFIFNNGMKQPEKFAYGENQAAGGVFIINSEKGGKVMPTEDIGVFELTAEKGKIAKIDGKEIPNGNVTLEPGTTNVIWVDGEQPEVVEEKTEIKLTIGDAKITTNGTAKELDVPAQLIDNRTMVPLRAIFEALGASVEWDGDTKTVTSVKGDTTVKLTVGENKLTVNGTEKALDVPGQIVENRTLVPVRAISEAFGCEVGWDAETRTVTITK